MAPGIALAALGDSREPLRVADPMAGSGTVVAVARAYGHHAYGFDIDPLAVLLADVWTKSIDPDEVRDKAKEVLSRARASFAILSSRCAYPSASDDETKAFVRYWFDDYSRRQLSALAYAILRVRCEVIRNALWCGFSRLIVSKQAGASLAMDLSHSRPHRVFKRAPVKPFNKFLDAVEIVAVNCPQRRTGPLGPPTVVKSGDARNLSLETGSIDLVVTSPPYLNAIDYMRCSKFALVWMGHRISGLREIRRDSVGTEAATSNALDLGWVCALIHRMGLRPSLSRRNLSLLGQYVYDMDRALAEVSRVLRPRGRAVYVVGDSTIRGTFVRNSSIVAALAEKQGLRLRARHSRTLPDNRRYLPPPDGSSTAALDGRMRKEVVVAFEKLAA